MWAGPGAGRPNQRRPERGRVSAIIRIRRAARVAGYHDRRADVLAAVGPAAPHGGETAALPPTVPVTGPVLLVGARMQPRNAPLPADTDIDLHVVRQRFDLRGAPWPVLGVISTGGALGTLARYGLAVAWPHRPDQFPWATFVTNVSGCLLIGILMVLITEVWAAHRLLRPFLGVGVLGGYTTFSTYTVDVQQLVAAGVARTGLAYLVGTLAAALTAVYVGITLTRLATRTHRRRKEKR
jgi:CrcB protein